MDAASEGRVCPHKWYVEDVPQGMVPRILCRLCPAEKPRQSGRGLSGGGPPVEPYADVPADVCDWLDETYTPDGVGIWLNAWANADQAKRDRMIFAARGDGNG